MHARQRRCRKEDHAEISSIVPAPTSTDQREQASAVEARHFLLQRIRSVKRESWSSRWTPVWSLDAEAEADDLTENFSPAYFERWIVVHLGLKSLKCEYEAAGDHQVAVIEPTQKIDG